MTTFNIYPEIDMITFNTLPINDQNTIIESVEDFANRVLELADVVVNDTEFLMLVEFCAQYDNIRKLVKDLTRCRTASLWTNVYRQLAAELEIYEEYHSLSFAEDYYFYEEFINKE